MEISWGLRPDRQRQRSVAEAQDGTVNAVFSDARLRVLSFSGSIAARNAAGYALKIAGTV